MSEPTLPLVATQGPNGYEAEAYVAGFEAAVIDHELAMLGLYQATPAARFVRALNLGQLDLIAARHGYTMHVIPQEGTGPHPNMAAVGFTVGVAEHAISPLVQPETTVTFDVTEQGTVEAPTDSEAKVDF